MRLDISQSKIDLLQVTEAIEQISTYHDHLTHVVESNTYIAPESSINLPGDLAIRDDVEKAYQEKVNSSLRYIFVCGIGGSSLGTKAVYEAMRGDENLSSSNSPKLIFLESISQSKFAHIERMITNITSPEQILVLIISKSGGTTEPIANAELILSILHKKLAVDLSSRVVAITDKDSKFATIAKKRNMYVLDIPQSVGGRYSVLTAVGLFPLLCAQIDIDGLLSGAMDMRNLCIKGEMAQNLAMQSAIVLYMSYKNGKKINTNFVFEPRLESLGKWYRQLMGESIGKKEDLQGNSVHVGITPEVSVGSTDLHSVAQLYMEGPRDKITTFISALHHEENYTIEKAHRIFPELVEMISEKSVLEIKDAILSGTKSAYTNADLPYMCVTLEEISTYEIGAFFQFKMIEMMYLGRFLNVNTFNQPGVESYKLETKKLLE